MERVVFIDIDILVQRNISGLLSVDPGKVAMASVTYKLGLNKKAMDVYTRSSTLSHRVTCHALIALAHSPVHAFARMSPQSDCLP